MPFDHHAPEVEAMMRERAEIQGAPVREEVERRRLAAGGGAQSHIPGMAVRDLLPSARWDSHRFNIRPPEPVSDQLDATKYALIKNTDQGDVLVISNAALISFDLGAITVIIE